MHQSEWATTAGAGLALRRKVLALAGQLDKARSVMARLTGLAAARCMSSDGFAYLQTGWGGNEAAVSCRWGTFAD